MQKEIKNLIKKININLDKQDKLRNELSKYKDGHLQMKTRNGKIYFYKEYREGKKVKTDYLGKEGSDALKNYLDEKNKIMDLNFKLNELKIEEKEIKNILKKLKIKNYRYVYTLYEIKKIIKPILKKYNIEIAYLFGSYARNEATKESDLDLLIKLPNKSKSWYEFETDVENAFNKEVDFIYDGDRLLNSFIKRIEKDMIFLG